MGNCAGRDDSTQKKDISIIDGPKNSTRYRHASRNGRASSPAERSCYVANYDYESRTQGDIPFQQGDKFEVLQKNGDWWFARHIATGREGFIPFNYVAECASIESEVWYFGKIRRAPAESRLLSNENPQGAFLIRVSETRSGEYSLSVRDGGTVKHYRIRHAEIQEGRGAVYFIARRTPFETMRELVEHYQSDADGLCTNLTKPCVRADDDEITPHSISPYDKWEIDKSSLRFMEKLGSGQFGEVHRGIWGGTTPVAIKSLKPGSMTVEDFLREAQCMKELRHPKLIRLYAVCTKEEPILIVTELMSNGSLSHYLQNGPGQNATIRDLVDFGAQVAQGMSYLESHNFIHRDLAARNVLVGRGRCVKVADFGLARMVDDGIYNPNASQRVPIKWTAPEAFMYQRFTTKSDVWSFGVLLSEIVTYGQTPYPGMSNKEVMQEVSTGYRMPRPDNCPEKLYDIMLETWRKEPQQRPTFEALQWSLEDYFINEGSEYRDNVP